MTTTTITTAAGHTIAATLDDSMPATAFRLSITQDGAWAGTGRYTETGQIVDIDARLGATDGSETEDAYNALEEALSAARAPATLPCGCPLLSLFSVCGRADCAILAAAQAHREARPGETGEPSDDECTDLGGGRLTY